MSASDATLGRTWPGALAGGALVAGACVVTAAALLVLSGISGTWLVLVCIALAAGAALALCGHPLRMLLCGYVLVAPVAISKAIATGAGVYAPALELTLADCCLVAIGVFWLVERTLGGRRAPRAPIVGLPVVALFFGWAWVSALHAANLSHGLLAALNLSKYLLAFVAVATLVRSRDDVRWVLTAAAAGLALQVGMVALQFVAGSSLVLQGVKTTANATMGYNLAYAGGVSAFRPSGFLQHPVFLADYLVIFLPTPVAFVLLGPRRVGRAAWLACLALAVGGTVALVLTMSRGGWLSFAVAIAFLLVVGVRRRLVRPMHLTIATTVAVLGAATLVVAYPPVLHRITGGDQRSGQSRMLMMEQAWRVIRQHPLLGVGMASYVEAAKSHQPPAYALLDPEFRKTLSKGVVHNAYMVFWAERGIVGLLGALALFGWFIRAFFRQRRWVDPAWHALALGITTGLVAQLAMYNFDHGYLDSRPGVLWLVFGLLAAVLRLQADAAPRRPRAGGA